MTFFNSGLLKVIKVPLSDWIVLLESLRGLRLHVKVGSVSLGASHLLSLILWSQSCLSLSSCLDSKWSFQLIFTRSTCALLSASSSKWCCILFADDSDFLLLFSLVVVQVDLVTRLAILRNSLSFEWVVARGETIWLGLLLLFVAASYELLWGRSLFILEFTLILSECRLIGSYGIVLRLGRVGVFISDLALVRLFKSRLLLLDRTKTSHHWVVRDVQGLLIGRPSISWALVWIGTAMLLI